MLIPVTTLDWFDCLHCSSFLLPSTLCQWWFSADRSVTLVRSPAQNLTWQCRHHQSRDSVLVEGPATATMNGPNSDKSMKKNPQIPSDSTSFHCLNHILYLLKICTFRRFSCRSAASNRILGTKTYKRRVLFWASVLWAFHFCSVLESWSCKKLETPTHAVFFSHREDPERTST